MRLLIVGVGQTLNFETKQMEDVLQVLAPDGSVLSVPTTNEAAQGLVSLAMNGNGHQEDPFVKAVEEMPRETMRAWQTFHQGEVVMDTVETEGVEAVEVEGADVFGGGEDGNALFRQVQETVIGRSRGVSQRMSDRSGIPSRTLSANLVDEKGNPVMSLVPEDTVEEEEDPGEQI